MKNLKLIFSTFILLLLVNSLFGQNRFYGTVTEVVDGKTIIVEPQPQIKIKIELQYIEVPEPEQKLHDAIKNHLSRLLLNKTVEFRPKYVQVTTKPIGQILLNGVDISQQMLRDGAAWYSAADKEIQGEAESKVYIHNESLAKNERRGVWSLPDLKPAWEFRAEKEARRQEELKKKAAEKAKSEEAKKENAKIEKVKNTKAQIDSGKLGILAWSTEVPYLKKNPEGINPIKGQYGLWYLQDVTTDTGWIATPVITFNVFEGRNFKEVILAAGYDYKGDKLIVGGNKFTIAIGSISEDTRHLKSDIYIEIDGGKKIKLSKEKRYVLTQKERNGEFYTSEISRDLLNKIGASQKATLVIGKYKREINKHVKDSFKALTFITAKQK